MSLDAHTLSVHGDAVEAVNSAAARKLYKKRQPIYPKAVHGVFRRAKWAFMIVLLGIYYSVPWIRWDRGVGRPDQAVLVDFGAGRFYFGPLELWPQEIYYITGLLILSALALFLFTALFGRVWCGYACPQTVWTDLFLFVERRIEGDRNAQLRLAKAPWSASKITKKATKHALWLLIAAATGGAWVFYFSDAPTLFAQVFTGSASITIYIFIGMLTFTTYSLAGTMREQVCTYMCPWPRIQAAMIDEHSLQVTYRVDRGEPRGAHKKGAPWEDRGDCVDCTQCVAACPMGIDIRHGSQLECINCALCIDACDEVMDRVGRPKGLIAYYNEVDAAPAKQSGKYQTPFVRPRTVLYASLIGVLGAAMLYALLHRATIAMDVIRDRSPAFVKLADGSVRNGYAIKILNMRAGDKDIAVEIENAAPGAVIKGNGVEIQGHRAIIHAPGDKVTVAHLFIAIPPASIATAPEKLVFAARDPRTNVALRKPSAFMRETHP
jgi:cytochrome c oxidase accessory protein FixG